MHRVDDLADIADAGAAGGVHFHHVDMAALGDCDAVLADTARVGRGATLAIGTNAVHALGDDPGGGGFPGPPDAGHDEGLRYPVGGKGVLQGAHHRVLPNEVSKRFGPVFPGQNLIVRWCLVGHASPGFATRSG